VKYQGRRSRKLFHSKADAKAWEVDLKRKLTAQRSRGIPRPTVTICLIDWINGYLDYAFRYTPKVYSEKQVLLKTLLSTWGNIAVEKITRGMALTFVQGIHTQRSGHAANKARKNLGMAWNHGVRFRIGQAVSHLVGRRRPGRKVPHCGPT
jgi:hypothetical protein